MSSEADQHADHDGYLQRAELLAELGRYEEAAAEVGFAVSLDPGSASASMMLARVHLAGERPIEALAAAETAAAADPGSLPPLVLRGLALIDLRRFAEAAQVADALLDQGPADAYAQRSAAAILAESRNGQPALNAAWRSVELVPTDSRNHLVLSLVSARLGLFNLAEQAYREALRLDPALAELRDDVGVIRLEQRRYSAALEELAETAAVVPPRPAPGPPAPPAPPPGRPAGVPAGPRSVAENLRRFVLIGAGYGIVAPVLVACVAGGDNAASRVWALLAAGIGFVLLWRFGREVPGLLKSLLPELRNSDLPLALAIYAVLAGPGLVLLYVLVGSPWPLVLAILGAGGAQFAMLRRPGAPPTMT